MNITRFMKKCLFDRPAAAQSARLVMRDLYGRFRWFFRSEKPLVYRFPTGGILLLEPRHFSTLCVWPDVDNYEPEVQETFRHILRSGDVFIDCGANIGFFSVLASGLIGKNGRVIAVEPDPREFKLLERNLKINHLEPGIQCALASNQGQIDLFMPGKGGACSSLRSTPYIEEDLFRSAKVTGRNLDSVIKERSLQRVDLVKIDIEGGELDAIRSAPYLLKNFRPFIIIEYSVTTWPCFGATRRMLQELAQTYHYLLRLFDSGQKKFTPIPEATWERGYINAVLVPEERVRKLE